MLIKAEPIHEKSPSAVFANRFGSLSVRPKKTTRLTQMLIEDRGQ
jgi:hypothetical protein